MTNVEELLSKLEQICDKEDELTLVGRVAHSAYLTVSNLAAEVERLRAENARLRIELKGFADERNRTARSAFLNSGRNQHE